MKAVFDTKPSSVYDDDLLRHYQFPRRYRSIAGDAVGNYGDTVGNKLSAACHPVRVSYSVTVTWMRPQYFELQTKDAVAATSS